MFLVPFIEILVIAVILNYLLSFFWNTRSMDLVLGFLAFLFIAAIASWMHLPVLQKITVNIVNVVVLAVLILFQPELRLALSKLSVKKSRRARGTSEFDLFLEQLLNCVYRLAEKRLGAIIVMEHQDSLEEYVTKAVSLNARFSPELLETIFVPDTPLHDGAVIIRGDTILCAAAILPLSEDGIQAKSTGTRHRAALGVSQVCDAVAIVISEETGKVSIARDGMMTHGIKADRFKGIIRSVFYAAPTERRRHKVLAWLGRT